MSPRWSFNAFAKAREGVAAVEFALLLPVFAFTYLASVEVMELMLVDRQVENIASSIADIVARDTIVTVDELDDLQEALPSLMAPKVVSGLQVRISSIQIVSATEARVVWSHGYYGMTPLPEGGTVNDIPSQILTNPNIPSIVRADVSYTYTPAIGGFHLENGDHLTHQTATYTLKHSDYRRPRLTNPLPFDDGT